MGGKIEENYQISAVKMKQRDDRLEEDRKVKQKSGGHGAARQVCVKRLS